MPTAISPYHIARHGRVAAALKEALARKGMRQRDLVKALGGKAASAMVNAWIRGRNGISPEYRGKVAEILDINPKILMPAPRSAALSTTTTDSPRTAKRRGRPRNTPPPAPIATNPSWHIASEPDGKIRIRADLILSHEQAQPIIQLLLERHPP